MVNGSKMKSVEKGFTCGQMDAPTLADGCGTICTAKEFILGRTAANMKANITKTKSTATEPTLGKTSGSMKVAGRTGNNTVKASTDK